MKLSMINEVVEGQMNPLKNDSAATVGLDKQPENELVMKKAFELELNKIIPKEPDDHMKPETPKGPG